MRILLGSLLLAGCGAAMLGCASEPMAIDAAPAADASSRDAGTDAATVDATDAWHHVAVDAHVDDAAGTDGGVAPGYSPPLPSRGGPVISHPYVVTLTYANDANRVALDAYSDVMVAETGWWSATTSEYGVGALASLGAVHLTDDAPPSATEASIQSYLLARAADGTIPHAPDGTFDGVMALLYFPPGAAITLSDGAMACSGWHGVHGEARAGTTHLVYALAIDCGAARGFDHLGYLEAASSHELVEAATDPFVRSAPAYLVNTSVADPWMIFGETTDRCVGRYLVRGASVLARSWSNAAGAAGTDPCVPTEPGEIFYGVWTPTTTVHGAPGTTLSVPITGFARASVPDFDVAARTALGRSVGPVLGRATLNEGISTSLRLTLSSAATSGTTSVVLLTIGPAANDARNYPILVRYD